MSIPVLSGEELKLGLTDDGLIQILNDPGFSNDAGGDCRYRAPSIWKWVGGWQLVWGVGDLPVSTPVSITDRVGVFGERFPSGATLPFVTQAETTYLLRMYAGVYFTGWGDHPEDAIEWGVSDLGRNPTGQVRINQVQFTTPPAEVTPPPPPPNIPGAAFPDELQQMIVGVNAERAMATAKSLEQWRLQNSVEFAQAWDYMCSLYAGTNGPHPNLKTHAGRWLVGRYKETEIVHRLGVPK